MPSPTRVLRFLRHSASQWPQMRAISRQWPMWVVRQLLMPARKIPMVITTRHGTRYELADDPVDDAILRDICAVGANPYFPPSGEQARHVEGVILDVGAHHGFYAVEALRRYPRCRVIAVEPDPASCHQLARNIALNDLGERVRIVPAALGSAPGQGGLVRDDSGSWATRVESSSSGDVRIATLEEILAGERPVIVKCNAEGAEFALVPQLVALALRPASMVLMAHPRFGSAAALAGELRRAGFEVRDADDPPRGQRFHCTR